MTTEGNVHRAPEKRRSTTRRGDRASPVNAVRSEPSLLLPSGYHLDVSDPDILLLRRPDGQFVAAFSAQGATRDGIAEAAWKDHRAREEGGR